ncbi:MAG: putative acetolactate synthase small subunit [Alphaproteobacteria bacterium ADurb.Bin438]|nr:MAG: putative acetolactate synthase small subunit [Alphaproteobacteria bacterium ADurb.Bin438]
MKFTIGVIVSNSFGVLNRVTAVYSKRGCNIDSLSVGETENQEYSRITILSEADDYLIKQIFKQLEKLHDVREAFLFDDKNSFSREHVFIKLSVNSKSKSKIIVKVNDFGGKIIDFGNDFVSFEISNTHDKISEIINKFKKHEILEVSRSGLTAISYGTENMLRVED